jgi:hypothetical protein
MEWVSRVLCDAVLARCILSHLPDIEDAIRLYLGTCPTMRAIALDDENTRWAPIFDWKTRMRTRLIRFREPFAQESHGVTLILKERPSFSLRMISRNYFHMCLGGCGCSTSNTTHVWRASVLPPYWCCVSCFLQMHHHEYAFADHMVFNMSAQGRRFGKCISDCMLEYLLYMLSTTYAEHLIHRYHQKWAWPSVLKCTMDESTMQFLPISRIRQLMADGLPEIIDSIKSQDKRVKLL